MKLVVIMPAFNEEHTIGNVIKQIPDNIDGIDDIRILVIDDGSKDQTAQIARDSGALVLQHNTNCGVGRAFKTGIEKALGMNADIIVNMDSDGQFNPEDIKRLIDPILKRKYDFVTCTRFKSRMKGRMPFVKYLGNKIFTKLISSLVGQQFSDTQCGFRAYSKEAASRLTVFGDYTYTQEVFIDLANKGMKMTEVSCRVRAERKHGKSRVLSGGILSYTFRSMKIILRAYRDNRPLVFFGVPGIFFTIIGLAAGLGSFIYWLIFQLTTPVKTYIQIAIFFTILGVVISVLALIADMFMSLRKRLDELIYLMRKR